MKVVFLEDVSNLGKVGETKEVADGYGRNYLLPRKLAVLAGSHASTLVEAKLKLKARLQDQNEAEMLELSKQIEGKELILKAKTGESERLYGSITTSDICEELIRSIGIDIDKRKVEMEDSIRQVGSYDITIRLTKDIMPKIKVTVVAEDKETVEDAEVKKTEKPKKAAKKAKGVAEKGNKAAEKKEDTALKEKAVSENKRDVKEEEAVEKKEDTALKGKAAPGNKKDVKKEEAEEKKEDMELNENVASEDKTDVKEEEA